MVWRFANVLVGSAHPTATTKIDTLQHISVMGAIVVES